MQINITAEQTISVNQAIFMLERSESDHAEQCLFYLKQLRDSMSKAKFKSQYVIDKEYAQQQQLDALTENNQ